MSGEKPIERKVYEAIQVGGAIVTVIRYGTKDLKTE